MYGDGLAAAHADISLRLAKQAAENNVHLNKTITDENQSKRNAKKAEKESAVKFFAFWFLCCGEAVRNRILDSAAKA